MAIHCFCTNLSMSSPLLQLKILTFARTISPQRSVRFMQSDSSRMEERMSVDARLLTLPEAARYLGCTVWAVRELIWKGELHYTRFGKRFQVDLRDLDVLIDREKRREGTIQPRRSGSTLSDFVVTSTPQRRSHTNGSTNTDDADGGNQKSPRRRLDIQTKISSEKR